MKQNNNEYLYDLTSTGYDEQDEQYKNFIEHFDKEACAFLDEFNTSLLQNAISHRKYNIAKFLIGQECNLNHQDERGYTALDYLLASKREGHLALIKDLLDANPNINIENEYGNQPLWAAVKNAKVPLSVIKKLLEMGAAPHHKNVVDKSPYDVVKRLDIPELNEIFEPYV